MSAKRSQTAREGGGKALRHGKKRRRIASGDEMNALVLAFMRRKDVTAGQPGAWLAGQCGMSRQRAHHLHKKLKVVTIPMLVQWCNGRGLSAAKMLDALEGYVAQGGSIECATCCQTYLP